MTRLHLDIETRSRVDLTSCGVYAYVNDPDFRILMCSWALDDDPVQNFTNIDEIHDIPGLFDPEVEKVAHNAQFERICFSRSLGLEGFWNPEDWLDTQALAAEAGYPLKLEKLAKALKVSEKDSAGTRLINLFSKPNSRTGEFVQPQDRPVQWREFIDYCNQDVITMRECLAKLPGWPTDLERQVWNTDQRINDRGILVDLELAALAVAANEENQVGFHAEMRELLDVENPNSVVQIKRGFAKLGLQLPNLRRETIEALLDHSDPLDPDHRRALELRLETSLVASDKYSAAIRSASPDSRYRGGLFFHGAHTGRWSSKGVQIQNPPKLTFTRVNPKTGKEEHDAAMENAAILDLHLGLGADPATLKKLVRAMFLGPFTVIDYASIEARILAWWAGEQWAVRAFEADRDIYVETANRMGGLTRAQGKIAVLALGYAGSEGSLRNMGYGAGMSREKVMELVYAWRRANPRIVRLWRTMESTFMSGGKVGVIEIDKIGQDRRVLLPSGRTLTYHNVRVGQGEHGQRILFSGPQGQTADTYGGRLTENIVQAISRDILAQALVRLESEGIPVVIHCHDEVVIDGIHDIESVSKIMCDVSWAEGLPLAAEGYYCSRYRKG